MTATLIVMTKAGGTIEVHPTCVADHQRIGWVIDNTPRPAEVSSAVTKTTVKHRAKKA